MLGHDESRFGVGKEYNTRRARNEYENIVIKDRNLFFMFILIYYIFFGDRVKNIITLQKGFHKE